MAKELEKDQGVVLPYRITVETNIEGLEYIDRPLVQAVSTTLESEKCPEADIDIILVDDEYLRELKKEYFGIDRYTDVIAFRINPYEEPIVEGEVYISLHRAAEQAMEHEITADLELLRLAIHGSLHLLGYEDDTPEKKQVMTSKEDRQLARYSDPFIVRKLP